jgi:hypothetical protein
MRFELPRKSARAGRPELWDPALLLTNYWFEPLGRAQHRGRPAIRVRLTDRDSADDYARLANRGEYEVLVDAERGILLRVERVGGSSRVLWDVADVAFDRRSAKDDDLSPPAQGTGDVLELLYTAKRRFSTLRAEFRTGRKREGAPFEHAEVWFHSRWKWRCEMDRPEGRQVQIANEARYWHGYPPDISLKEVGEDGFRGWFEVPFEEHWDGGLVIPGLWLEVLGEDWLDGVSVIRVRGTPRPHDEYWQPRFWSDLNHADLLVDSDLGVIRQLAMHEDGFDSVQELIDIELGPDLPDDLFAGPR